MTDRLDDGVWALFMISVGLYVLVERRKVVQSMLDSHKPIWNVFGQEQGSDTAGRIFGNILVIFVGIVSILAGLAILYSAVTGNDWPFHYVYVPELHLTVS